jgi:hypothetical protein
MGKNATISELWRLTVPEFNDWRRSNDLMELLEYFKVALPHFQEWQESFGIDDPTFLSADKPSKFFRGGIDLFFQSVTGPDHQSRVRTAMTFSKRESVDDSQTQIERFGKVLWTTNSSLRFTPYFQWLRRVKHILWFPIVGDLNKDVANDFRFTMWEAMGTENSNAFLFGRHRVLKLGSTSISVDKFDERNLDFASLDDLVITGEGATHSTTIAYSSCNRMQFINCEKAFATFSGCHVEGLTLHNCQTQDFEFEDCTMSRPVFRKTRLFKTRFVRTAPGGVTFDACELSELRIIDPPKPLRGSLGEFYKRIRVAFQHQGNTREASQYYYEERRSRLRGHFSPFVPSGPPMPPVHALRDLRSQWERQKVSNAELLRRLGQNSLSVLKILLLPHLLARFLWAKRKIIPDTFDWALWGFGERPGRVFAWMACVIALFTIRNFWGINSVLSGQLASSFYCSVFNFATMGCDQKTGVDSIEGILGATLVGLMVAGFANRTRY